MKRALIILFASIGVAHAGWYEELNKATELIKSVTSAVPTLPIPAKEEKPQSSRSSGEASTDPAAAVLEPLGLEPLAGGHLYKRYLNPLDRVRVPLSVPEASGDTYVSRYSVPMEARVTQLQYLHPSTESPLRLYRHYTDQLEALGMERLMHCSSDGKAKCSTVAAWRRVVDPAKQLDYFELPHKTEQYGVYFDGKGAFALIGTGRNGSDKAVTLVYVVEGQVLDKKPIEQVRARNSNTVSKPSSPVSPPPAQATATNEIEQVEPRALPAFVARSKGTLVVQLSSEDEKCSYCIVGNAYFAQLAEAHKDKATYVQALWQPWRSVGSDPFARAHQVQAIPATLTFVNGKLVNRTQGALHHDELYRQALKDLVN